MKKVTSIILLCVGILCMHGCGKETKNKDRGNASEMFERICRLTEEYTGKLAQASDSVDWAALCMEYEEKLDKISLSYPPDTDLLLTEGQNDTINFLMREYVRERQQRLYGSRNPEAEEDSIEVIDSLNEVTSETQSNVALSDASRSLGN